jgi:hypothetical protein
MMVSLSASSIFVMYNAHEWMNTILSSLKPTHLIFLLLFIFHSFYLLVKYVDGWDEDVFSGWYARR